MTKYNAVKTTVDGIQFDSRREAQRYQELRLMERAGQIMYLMTQPKLVLIPAFVDGRGKRHRALTYFADFSYVETDRTHTATGGYVIEDVKGMETPVFKLKHKLLMYQNPGLDFRIIR